MQNKNDQSKKFDLQGHRGCRGLIPENTIPAFIKAIDLGVSTLEMDVVITGDGQVLVSHEPYINAEICLDPEGNAIPDSTELSLNIYQMDYDQVRQYDCGLKQHPRFPEQEKMTITKPLLVEVIDLVERYPKTKNRTQLNYNIEIKSMEIGDEHYHPEPASFSELVYKTIDGRLNWVRITIQSFDFRILRYFHSVYPDVRLAVLIENERTVKENLDELGFFPEIYSCDYSLLSRENIDHLHALGLKVIPWTVNEKADMKRLIDWEVDGLITDYPNRYNELKDE